MNRWSKRWRTLEDQRREGKRLARDRHEAERSVRGINKIPSLSTAGKRGSATLAIPSLQTTGGNCERHSMTDPMTLRKESPETRAAILAKASRIAPLYNKGNYQYVTEEQHPSRGKRNP